LTSAAFSQAIDTDKKTDITAYISGVHLFFSKYFSLLSQNKIGKKGIVTFKSLILGNFCNFQVQ
jgi:hypothetical protein